MVASSDEIRNSHLEKIKTLNTNYVSPIGKNSSITNLTTATSLTFTGEWFDCSGYSKLSYLLNTNVSGDIYFDLSIDSTVVDLTTTVAITGGVPVTDEIQITSKYIRVRYTADSDTTTFRLQSIFKR